MLAGDGADSASWTQMKQDHFDILSFLWRDHRLQLDCSVFFCPDPPSNSPCITNLSVLVRKEETELFVLFPLVPPPAKPHKRGSRPTSLLAFPCYEGRRAVMGKKGGGGFVVAVHSTLICVSVSPPPSTAHALFHSPRRSRITASMCGRKRRTREEGGGDVCLGNALWQARGGVFLFLFLSLGGGRQQIPPRARTPPPSL